MQPKECKKNLTEHAFDALRADILTCRMKPGSRIKIKDVCQEYDVSLGAVREALSRLTAETLVVAEAQRGFRVAPVSKEDLLDLTDTRIEIENLCLGKSIKNATLESESRILAAFHILSGTGYWACEESRMLNDYWVKAHSDFHEALVANCDSQWLLKIRHSLYEQSERYRRLSVPLSRVKRNVAKEHEKLMKSVLAKDVKMAHKLMSEHLRKTTGILIEFGPE